jgi:PAS domain S-box-containing protein
MIKFRIILWVTALLAAGAVLAALADEAARASLAGLHPRIFYSLLSLGLLAALLLWYYGRKTRIARREQAQRLQAEAALSRSEARYRELVENADCIILHRDGDGRILFFNEFAERFFGFAAGEVIGKNVVGTIVPPVDSAGRDLAAMVREIGSDLERYADNENENIRKDGSRVWVHWTNRIIRNKAGGVEILAIGRDITDRRLAAAALRESDEKFRKAFYTSPDAVNINRLEDGRYVSINEGFTRMTGYTEGDVLGRTSLDVSIWTDPEDRRRLVAGLKEEGEVRNLEALFRIKNGEIRCGLMSASMIDLKGEPHLLSITRDITERKLEEQKFRGSLELFLAVFEHVQAGIFLIDAAAHTIVSVNPMAAKLCGVPQQEILGKVCHNWICPAEEGACPITDCGQRIDNAERVLLNGQGKEIPVLKTVVPVQIAGRDYLLESFVDLTERQRLSGQLLQAQKMEAIGTLAGGLAHDFNNLLMGIQGVASLLMLDFDPSDARYERLKMIEEQVKSGANLTRQLLGFARGGRYEVKPLDFRELIDKTVTLFGRTHKEIEIHRRNEPALWPVEVDRGQMEQVLLNLYVNAWQAMPAGGSLYLETENVHLGERDLLPEGGRPGRYVKISVTDTGIGMDKRTLRRVFDPFFTTKAIGRGSGLGLAMVYGIIQGHRGRIGVYSEPGHGTTFTIYLPASKKAVVQEKPEAAGQILPGKGTILLVDDEPVVLTMSREMLEHLGYRVYPAGSGQEAIAVFLEKQREVDLVVLDMIMAGISGGEAFDRLRQIDPEVRVLLSSGYSVNGQAQQILDRGCRGFLQKPFTLEDLSRKVREALQADAGC